MNIYGLLMALGWLYCSYGLKQLQFETQVCNIDIDYISFFWLIFTIAGSKLFQKIVRNTWEGNASHGALYGTFLYLCLISDYCDVYKIVNRLSLYFPVLYFFIRLGNLYNNEHYISRSSAYIQLYEGLLQGPFTLLCVYLYGEKDAIILFMLLTSSIRVYFEFLRDSFDPKNVIIPVVMTITTFFFETILSFRTSIYILFVFDLMCKLYLDNSLKNRNYGFNFSLLNQYNLKFLNKIIHLCLFPIVFYYNNIAITLGALGNLLERLINGYVSDYISVPIYPFNRYSFNIADILVTFGLIWDIISRFFL
jgi:signal peptidase II